MYLRRCYRRKDGKRHAYWALVEICRTNRGPRQRVVAWLGVIRRAGPSGSEALRREAHWLSNGLVQHHGTRMGGSRCEARARGTQPEIWRPLARKRGAAPVGTGSLSGRDASERTRGDSLVDDGGDFDSQPAV